ncbi:MAG TPA: pyridoxamine 5'-phosphate oxidase family protein [Myxococcaceae bacterium]|jgi:nitroimidazol reductase NimA-like FMN-containing flavoprotein (pyridoxamine 5'-phosphate oxidase superfamily)
MRLKKSVAQLVGWQRVCRVATVDSRRRPHMVPVCHVLADGKLFFASGKDARKVRNLRAVPSIAVTVDLYADDWSQLKGVMIQGKAAIIEKGPRFRKLRKLLYAKYPQYPEKAALEERDSVIVEVTPTNVFSWGLD